MAPYRPHGRTGLPSDAINISLAQVSLPTSVGGPPPPSPQVADICGCGNDDEYSSVGPSDVSRRVPNPVMGREMLEALLLNKSSHRHIVSYCTTTTTSPQQELTMCEAHMAILCH